MILTLQPTLSEASNLLKLTQSCVIIGISGVTCSGKTSTVALFSKYFKDVQIVNQDDFYFFSDVNSSHPHPNWDCISSIDMNSLVERLNTLKLELTDASRLDTLRLILIDGFSLFNFKPLTNVCHLKYFITLSYDECQIRRRNRNRLPPEPVGYFEQVAWPMYLSNLADMNRTSDAKEIRYLDGRNSKEVNFLIILKNLVQFLNKN